MVVFGQRGFIRAKVVVFLESGCIGDKWLYLVKMAVFPQSVCIRSKVFVFLQSGCIWEGAVVFGQKS